MVLKPTRVSRARPLKTYMRNLIANLLSVSKPEVFKLVYSAILPSNKLNMSQEKDYVLCISRLFLMHLNFNYALTFVCVFGV